MRRQELVKVIAEAARERRVALVVALKGIGELPGEIGQLTNLRTLHLSSNELTTLPKEIGELVELRALILRSNRLMTLPGEIGRLVNLEALDLGSNNLTTLPDEIGRLAKLRRLLLSGNQLTTLPSSLAGLGKLEQLELYGNPLADLDLRRASGSGPDAVRAYLRGLEEPTGADERLVVRRTGGLSEIGGGADASREQVVAPTVAPRKREGGGFDVFLCYNSEDRPTVKEIGERLKERGLLPWLDEWELRPGLPWQRALEEQIRNIRSAAVFVGRSGTGPWQEFEVEAYLRQFVKRKCPVIPVILPGSKDTPELPLFLESMTWVDFRGDDSVALDRLIWGVTGERRGRDYREKGKG